MAKILLDYFMPISSIEPTPQASTAFLKQVCVVVKPKDGGVTTGVTTVITSPAGLAALNTNADVLAEVTQLFAGGVSKAYILPMNDLDLADALESHGSDFFTILISADFTDEDIGQDVETPAVKASKVIGEILFEAVKGGVLGNDITIELAVGADAGEEVAHAVDKAITVLIEDGVSTAQMIIDAITDSVSCSALITAIIDPDTVTPSPEDEPQAVVAPTNLENGDHAVYTDGTGVVVGTFAGVVGVASDDDEFLESQAAIENRAAFHSTTANRGKNLFYAFGKMLSNALNWRNQQYITMQTADDVTTKGDAEALFDSKISFVLSDDEFGKRLALFAVGGKAIVAPYITRNLQIDMQSSALSDLYGNQPAYTKKQAALLEDELQKVIQLYIDREWIEAGTVAITIEQDNFVASGAINIAEPKALWRIFTEMRQSL